ncbi:S1 family peptidase [Nocardioides hwasunensis]|uniref:S1 family peptidase n=1 Tax=Nocardioides hwasunensis TaxID=397258 RepID=A0ABR8MP97_9ACTN|nr:S1 family peptidase [Nocardioides hwasunensis]MBD3916349.1 S1 family peptidase [Nocardioides hwasunensis]
MSTSRLTRASLGVATLAAAALGLGALTAPTATAAPDDPAPRIDRSAVSPGLVAAMKRDLGLDAGQVRARLRTEAKAPATAKRLQKKLGSSYAGSWIADGATKLTVATTDRREAAAIRKGGARAVVVRHSEADLTADREALDSRAGKASEAIHSWYVDVATNSVVVTAAPGAQQQARAFAERSGAGSVRVETSTEAPRTVADIRGGDEYVINGGTLCSVGFAVAGGFVTAGHCGGVGAQTSGFGQAQGVFEGSSFPDNDYAFVRTNGNWVSQPWVYNYDGAAVLVFGSQDAAVGSSVCRSGRTSQWTCGTLQGRNETVNYGGDTVYGLSRMSACANPGDSGGSVISGNQAQGVTSGIAGGCGSSNPQTWFQPVNEILDAYGLSLTTG